MNKTKIIVGIIFLTALVISGYFYFQNWRNKNRESLFGSVSTTFEQPSEEKSQVDVSGEISKTLEPGEAEDLGQSVQLPPKIITSENPVETISHPELPAESEIHEQISKPEIPSEITEKKFSPVAPAQSMPETPIILTSTKSTENEEESEESTSTSTPAILPQVSIYLLDYSITARSFTVIWQSSSTDVSTYDVDSKINFGDWQNWLASTTATSTTFQVLQDNTVYFFRARATNSAGLTGDWQEISAPINLYPIVINEIAWMGNGTSTASDEWIELFNKTNQQIDLLGWNLKSITNNTPNCTTTGIIEANGFFLLERTDDTTIKDIVADQIYSGDLNNTGEILELRDNFGNLIDEVPLSDSGKWLAGKGNPDYQSMERVNPFLPADVPGNWQSNNGLVRNGLNAVGQPINGTPKAQNSVFDLEFFYLYLAKNTTATSTILEWTPSYINNFDEYKVIRSFDAGFNSTSTTIIAATTNTDFFDESLESETVYYYKISACDLSDYCVLSNIASTTTSEFPFLWAEPQIIFEISTSTPDDQIFDFVLDADNHPLIIWLSATSTSATAINTAVNLLNNKNKPYVFWVGLAASGDGIYFTYQKDNGRWQTTKKVFNSPQTIMRLRAVIDSQNIAYIVWENDQREIWYTFGKIE